MKKIIFLLVIIFCLTSCSLIDSILPSNDDNNIIESDKITISNLTANTNEITFSYDYKGTDYLFFELHLENEFIDSIAPEQAQGEITIDALLEETKYTLLAYESYSKTLSFAKKIYQNYILTDYFDAEAPVVNNHEKITITIGSDYENILAKQMVVSDNHDSFEDLTFVFSFPEKIEIGLVVVSYCVTDKKGNSSSGQIVVNITNDPYGPEIEVDSTSLTYYSVAEVPDLKSLFVVYDQKDGQILVNDSMLNMTNEDLKLGLNYLEIAVTDSDNNESKLSVVIEIKEYSTPRKTTPTKNITMLDEYSLPSVGSPNVLVIPVAFSGYPATEEMRETIYKGFFGSSNDTGWESLNSYYYKSSYGKLNITGTVTDWYYVQNSKSYYVNYRNNDDIHGSAIILSEALEAYKKIYNYNNFDTNSDGVIDAIYLIYNVPIYGNQTANEEDFFWAYTSWDTRQIDYGYDVISYDYVFAAYDFFKEKISFSKRQPKINCETIIHETGHLLGINDFYDTDENDKYHNIGGFGGADMMDYNIGDHHPYTKMMLGWVKPTVVNLTGTYYLSPSVLTGDFLLITNGKFEDPFSEYFIIDFYSFKGLNSLEMPGFYNSKLSYAGVRITKINAKATFKNGFYYLDNNNSNTLYKEIELMEADYNGQEFDIKTLHYKLLDAYQTTSSLTDYYLPGGRVFGDTMWDNFRLSDGSKINFTMKVLAIEDDIATVRITFK